MEFKTQKLKHCKTYVQVIMMIMKNFFTELLTKKNALNNLSALTIVISCHHSKHLTSREQDSNLHRILFQYFLQPGKLYL